MKVKLDSFLKAENLGNATPKAPQEAVIKTVKFIEPEDLKFKSEEGRYELSVDFGEEEYLWMANKTSLRVFLKEWGDESSEWIDKKIGLYALSQNVSGEMKEVVYASII